jgi:hypothetical protein
MPLIRRGDVERATGTQRFFRADCAAGWYDYSWVARPRQRDPQTGKKQKQAGFAVSVRICVYHPKPGKTWAFAAWGLKWDPYLLAKRYRRRFGIESSYRQLGQVLPATSSTDARLRLLYVGLALLLRQYWAWAHYEILAERRQSGPRRLQPQLLRLACLSLWLLFILMQELRFRLEVETTNPAPSIPDL